MNVHKQPLTTEYALLGFLQKQPMHGYEILQRIQTAREDGLVWQVKRGMLYAVLTRLEGEELLVSSLEMQGVRPPRKLFSLTAKGETLFQAWLQMPVRNGRDFRVEFLTKLYFAARTGNAMALALIRRQLATSQAQTHRLAFTARGPIDPDSFAGLVSDFRIGQMEATLAWLRHCETYFVTRQSKEDRV